MPGRGFVSASPRHSLGPFDACWRSCAAAVRRGAGGADRASPRWPAHSRRSAARTSGAGFHRRARRRSGACLPGRLVPHRLRAGRAPGSGARGGLPGRTARTAGFEGGTARVPHPAHRRAAPGQGDTAKRGRSRAHPRGGRDGEEGPLDRRPPHRFPRRLPLAGQGPDQRRLRLATHPQRRAAPATLRHRHRGAGRCEGPRAGRGAWSRSRTRTCSSPAAP